MQPGKFDTRVIFQRKVRTSDGGGGFSVDWHPMPGASQGKRWAAVWPVTQNKADEEVGSKVANAPDYTVTVRSDQQTREITTDWRVRIKGREFAIKSVTLPDRQRGEIKMIVQEGQAT